MAEEKIVEAVFTSSNSSSLGGGKTPLSKLIEQAMSDAVLKSHKAGVFEPNEVRKAMLAARAQVKEEYNKLMAEAAEALTKKLAAEG